MAADTAAQSPETAAPATDTAGLTSDAAETGPGSDAADTSTETEPGSDATATTAAGPDPTGAHFSESLVFDPGTTVAESGVGYLFGLEWLSANWTLTNEGDVPVLVASGVPMGLPVQGPRPEEMVSPDEPDRMTWVTSGPAGRLRVSQQVFPMLEGQPPADFAVPAQILEPGSGLGGHALAMLPARASYPSPEIFLVPEPHGLPEDATEWEFCLQLAPVPDDLDPAAPVIRHDTPGAGLLCSPPAELPADWATRPLPDGPPYRSGPGGG